MNAQQYVRQAQRAALAILDPLYRRLKYSSMSVALDTAPVRRLRSWVMPGMGPSDVVRVIDTLACHGVPSWLVGGWGIDALLGRQTRKHWDVDVAIERSDLERAVSALEGDGFAVVKQEILPAWMPRIIVLRDSRRRWIDLMLVDVPAPAPGDDTRPASMQFHYAGDSFAEGMLDGRVVRCLSAPVALLFRTGYPPRASDRRDVRLLTSHFGQPAPERYQ